MGQFEYQTNKHSHNPFAFSNLIAQLFDFYVILKSVKPWS